MAKNEWVQALELSFADRSAERSITDTGVLNILRGSILLRTVMLLEAAGANIGSNEQNALREMRNAIAHNEFDVNGNRNPLALQVVRDYLSDLQSGLVPSANPKPLGEFFSLTQTTIVFDKGDIGEACRQILMKYL